MHYAFAYRALGSLAKTRRRDFPLVTACLTNESYAHQAVSSLELRVLPKFFLVSNSTINNEMQTFQ